MPNGAEKSRADTPVEDILEDVFGFNFRSFRTLWDILIRPNIVFRAYAQRDRDTYTPALRLWIGLTVVLAVITFFFGGHAEMMTQIISNWPEAQRETVLAQAGGDLTELTETYAQAFSVIQPISIVALVSLTVFLTALFDGGKSWVARINITYTVLTAGSIVGLVMFPFLVRYPELGMWAPPVIWLSYALTMFRGAPGVVATSMTGRIFKSIAFSTLTTFLVLVSGILTMMASLTYAIATLQQPG